MRPISFLLALSLAAPAAAQDAMTAEEFESYVTGRTLTYHDQGEAYGIEQYLPNRQVRWAYLGDECWDGYWYAEGENICFVYEHDTTPKCWRFTESGGRLSAVFMGSETGRELYEVENSEEPLVCRGPDVGV
ncbi:hypothetical protein P1J78_04490 [Psychromarinibacter sp. C21-152]|uniref:Beta/Gamma crystallin n=1 Tax=Psychromarinibacter sediminicola TaxID=3033385 RepID=A0AAE3NQ32_9RHOB|nr:hypothetical protein [Psychromarinibacter sediminicola]MDF0599982.1 hypothetical protein [Psychromarinibacter sediminicola]